MNSLTQILLLDNEPRLTNKCYEHGYMSQDWDPYYRDNCYFCGEDGVLDAHHIVPQRHGGSDDVENLVKVCPTCHRKLERLYNSRFYEELGLEEAEESSIHESVVDFKDRAPVDALEGIGEGFKFELYEADIRTVGELAVADPEEIAATTNLTENQLERWVIRARDWEGQEINVVRGISDRRAEKFEDLGIRSIRHLANADPQTVADKTEFSESQIEKWMRRVRIEMY